MAKPRVFVSSTHYDLKHVRASLFAFIEELGYESVLSEKGAIAYTHDRPLDESCYREAKAADIFVLIIGGRYGSEASGNVRTSDKDFHTRYESITKQEYLAAIDEDIPTYVLIEKGVYSDYETYLNNKDNETIRYVHVDSINICKLIEEIVAQPRNNPIYQFERFDEIRGWLRDQWAGLFRELLNRMSGQRQLTSLAAQVGSLAEVNTTLKTYLEELMSKVAPDEAGSLIRQETERLDVATSLAVIGAGEFCVYLGTKFSIPPDKIRGPLIRASTTEGFLKELAAETGSAELEKERQVFTLKRVTEDLNLVRIKLGLPSLMERDDPLVTPTPPRKRRAA
ncbi:MAG: hypothetical protein FD135_4345 [Comamonadaceae bacterium]|nr:MAG: hypothetical protein FD135_4345 [Comamonadaceae bacterium]